MRGQKLLVFIMFTVLLISGMSIGASQTTMAEYDDMSDLAIEAAEIIDTEVACTFLENKGQIPDSEVLLYGVIPGGHVGFGESSLFLWAEGCSEKITLKFVGSEGIRPHGRDEVPYHTNYFLGSKGTFTDITGYGSVLYEDIWLGIDLEYLGTREGAKYEFRVDPLTDPNIIAIEVSSSHDVRISDSSIEIHADRAVIVDNGLEVYQEQDAVTARFIEREENIFGVELGQYNFAETLIIDPLLYSTFVGGSDIESCAAIEIDEDRNVYVTGTTRSSNLPTVGPYDGSYNGNADVAVFKLNPTGNTLLYLTYVGGTNSEWAEGSAIDDQGCIYVTGTTSSTDFPTVNAYDDERYTSPSDECFIFKLNPAGNDLLYSTYVNLTREGRDIEVDSNGNMFVGGAGITGTSIDPTHIFKISSDGSTILYAYNYTVGAIESIALDVNGNVYVTGIISSSGLTTKNAFDDTYNGLIDTFVLKLNSTGDLEYGTYFGGTNDDRVYGIAVDDEGCAYITGQTRGAGFPLVNAYDDTYGGSQDAFVTKFNPAGNSLNYSTYIGGSGYEYGFDIVLDDRNNAYVAGEVISSDFPTVNAIDDTFNGERDTPVWKLNSTGNGLLYSTYLGGSQIEFARGVALDNETSLYVAGSTESTNFPVVNAYDDSYNGGAYDFYVTKLADMSDEDNDGLPNYNETLLGTDRFNWDSDYDLMSDYYEVFCGLNPLANDANGDLDSDTLTNLQEYQIGTWAFYYDTDFDLLPDPWEVKYGTDPLVYDADDDPDQDGLDNLGELNAGTHPFLNDTDSDFLEDSDELVRSCDPLSNDTDQDSILDGLEVYTYHTSPISNDTDMDNVSDPDEIFIYLSNPLDEDSDDDLMPDGWEAQNGLELTIDDADEDPDEDTLTNLQEYENGTDPHMADSDQDGIGDAWEVINGYDPNDSVVPITEILHFNLLPISIGVGGVAAVLIVVIVMKRRG